VITLTLEYGAQTLRARVPTPTGEVAFVSVRTTSTLSADLGNNRDDAVGDLELSATAVVCRLVPLC
jgi:hypothetical protein